MTKTNKHDVKICPICGREYTDYPAISRRDNKTDICPDCGLQEALDDFFKHTNKEDTK